MANQTEKIDAFQVSVSDQLTAVNTALDAMSTSQADIAADEKALLDKIVELQNTAGDLTPENQAKLDAIVASAQSLSAKSQAQADAFKALADSQPNV